MKNEPFIDICAEWSLGRVRDLQIPLCGTVAVVWDKKMNASERLLTGKVTNTGCFEKKRRFY